MSADVAGIVGEIASSGWQWGTFGEYVAGVGTLLAVLIAFFALRQERKQTTEVLALERERWATERQDRERWQSNFVSCHVSHKIRATGQTPPHFHVDITNDSPAPVSGIYAFKRVDDFLTVSHDQQPTSLKSGDSCTRYLYVTEEERFALSADYCGVIFTDITGIQWMRFTTGELLKADFALSAEILRARIFEQTERR